jgi:hypothetical protein
VLPSARSSACRLRRAAIGSTPHYRRRSARVWYPGAVAPNTCPVAAAMLAGIGRKHPTLGSTPDRRAYLVRFHDAGLKPPADKTQHPLVANPPMKEFEAKLLQLHHHRYELNKRILGEFDDRC